MKSPETLTIFGNYMLVSKKVTLLSGGVIKLHKAINV